MEFLGISSSGKQLLPGLPDDITLGHIVPKLPWRAFHALSPVSRWWRATIRTRKVYDARVASDATEPLVVFNYTHSKSISALALYSPTDNAYHRLPPLPDCAHGSLPWDCQFIALDGKLYVLGGRPGPLNSHNYYGSAQVFVLDLAGQRQWTPCASMEERREEFGSGVLDGKIYIFGGRAGRDPVTFSEVFDPKADTWSRIAPMKSYRYMHQVLTVGKMFCMHGRTVRKSDEFDAPDEQVFNPMIWNEFDSDDCFSNLLEQVPNAYSWEVYHPARDMWRVMEPPHEDVPPEYLGRLFMAQGEIYKLSELGIHHLEFDEWTLLGSLSCDALGPSDSVSIHPIACAAVGDEILAMVQSRSDCNKEERCLLRSRGFGSEDREIEWQKSVCPLEFGYNASLCLLQL